MELRSGGRKKILFMSFFANSRDDCFRICDQLHRQHRPDLFEARGGASAVSLDTTPAAAAAVRQAPRAQPDGGEGGSLSERASTCGADAGTILSLALPPKHGKQHHPPPHASMTPLGTSARRIRAVTAGNTAVSASRERSSGDLLPTAPFAVPDPAVGAAPLDGGGGGEVEAARRGSLSAAAGRQYRGGQWGSSGGGGADDAAGASAAAGTGVGRSQSGEALSSSGGSTGSPAGRPLLLGAIEESGGDGQPRRYRGSSTGEGSDGGHSGGASSAALTFRDDGIAAEGDDDEDADDDGEEDEEGGGGARPAESVPAIAWQALPPVSPELWARVGRMKVLLDLVLPLSPAGERRRGRGGCLTSTNSLRLCAEFHEHCLAETAGFSVAAMHRAKKHFDLTCSPWAQTVAADDGGDAGGRRDVFVTRTLRFTMALDPMPFTPKQTSVEKVQRYSQFAGPLLAVESSTRR